MPATLFLSPTIDIATQHSLAELGSFKSGDPFTQVTFLLPTGRVILEAAGSRIHLISDTSVRRLVRVTLLQISGEG